MIMGVETINGRLGLRVAILLQVKVRGGGLSQRPIGCTPALSVTQNAAAAAVAAYGAI